MIEVAMAEEDVLDVLEVEADLLDIVTTVRLSVE
jgi:hypothetical protein